MIRASIILFVLLIHATFTTCVKDQSRASRAIQDAENDLRLSAQLKCSGVPNYTAISLHNHFRDLSARSELDYFLRGSSAILAYVPESIVAGYTAMPATLTGTNVGLAIGMTGNVSKIAKDVQNKRPSLYFPLKHPRQNGSFCAQMSTLAERGISSFYYHMREDYKSPYLTLLSNAVVHQSGYVAQECGWLQTRMGCGNRVLRDARLWRKNITSTIKSSSIGSEHVAWQSATSLQQALGRHLAIHDEVFVIDVAWDFNYHHFLVDSVTRLVPFYNYFRRYEHIKIHIREEEKNAMNVSDPLIMKWINESRIIRQRVFDLLEISADRVISGPLIARKVYLPSEPECASFFKNALVLRLLAHTLQRQARKMVKSGTCDAPKQIMHPHRHRRLQGRSAAQRRPSPKFMSANKGNRIGAPAPSQIFATQRKFKRESTAAMNTSQTAQLPTTHTSIIIQWRSCAVVTPSNETRTEWRCFTDTQRQQLHRATEEVFPQSNVVLANTSLSTPLACDITLYRNAHLVIGLHGAAMTNAMFMRPGTVLVEIVGEYDRRMPPVCGYYGPFAAVFGVHHFIYYYNGIADADSLDMADVVAEASKFYNAIRMRSPYTEYSVLYDRYDFNTTFVVPAHPGGGEKGNEQ